MTGRRLEACIISTCSISYIPTVIVLSVDTMPHFFIPVLFLHKLNWYLYSYTQAEDYMSVTDEKMSSITLFFLDKTVAVIIISMC